MLQHRKNKTKKKAFTIIELSLSMVFISIMVIAVVTLLVRISALYNKGLVTRSINDVGNNIIQTVTKDAQRSSALRYTSGNEKFGSQPLAYDTKNNVYYNDYMIVSYENYGDNDTSQKWGFLCLSSSFYVWNTAQAILAKQQSGSSVRALGYRGDLAPIGLVRYSISESASSGFYCNGMIRNIVKEDSINASFLIGDMYSTLQGAEGNSWFGYPDRINREEILSPDSGFALYDFSPFIVDSSTSTDDAILSVDFVLATVNGGINMHSTDNYCASESKDMGNLTNAKVYSGLDYCAVNNFSFNARLGYEESGLW